MSFPELKNKILDNRDQLAEKIMAEQSEIMPEIKDNYTDQMLKKSRDDTVHNLNYLAHSIYVNDIEIFAKYYSWLHSVLEGRGLGDSLLENHLLAIKNVFKKELEIEKYNFLLKFIDAVAEEIKEGEHFQSSFLSDHNPLKSESEKYLNYLLEMKREKAVKFILDLSDQGISVEEIYLNILQNVQYEIGRLWQINQISVAHEHYATSVTQLAMSQLYPKIFNTYEKDKKCLTTCIGDELHELGIRMVADLLEIDGWDTIHLGANTPINEIIKMIEDYQIDLLAVSATMPTHLEETQKLINRVKNNNKLKELKIIVGGRLFLESSNLWQKLGADAFAGDAKAAVKVADSLL